MTHGEQRQHPQLPELAVFLQERQQLIQGPCREGGRDPGHRMASEARKMFSETKEILGGQSRKR